MAVTGLLSCDNDSEPRAAAPPAPAAITSVFPPDRFLGASPEHISVAFDLLRDGGVDVDSIRLAVDGRDVTDRARRAGTEDQPQSRAELIYVLDAALSDGTHGGDVEYRGGGATYRFAWEFTVRS